MSKFKIGIVGGAGYTGGELLRILIHHPNANIIFVNSKSNAGKPVSSVHTDLIGDTDLEFSEIISLEIDVLFMCMGHGDSVKYLNENIFPQNIKIIDLSQDFRPETSGFIYGLPELKRDLISKSSKIANPGCFATCIQLGLLPLSSQNLLHNDIHISATTGSTGAGQSLSKTSHFSWRNNNLSAYKVFEHQHLKEIKQSITQLQSDFSSEINFVPYRGDFTRGILATIYTQVDISLEEAYTLYESYYLNHPFTHVVKSNPDLKQVINTNKCLVYLEKHGKNLVIISLIDNLTKGASGQAVQNFNLIFGLDEKTGLGLKSIGF